MWQRHTSGRGQSSALPRCRQGAWGRWEWTPKKGLIVNSRHLCHKPKRNKATANLKGQNGRVSKTKPRVVAVTCQKRRKAKKRRAKRSTGHIARASRVG